MRPIRVESACPLASIAIYSKGGTAMGHAHPAARPADAAIEALGLAPVAKAAAYELKRRHPDVVFTSGRRDIAAQALSATPAGMI